MEKNKSIPRKDVDFHVVQKMIVDAANVNRRKWNLNDEWLDNILLPAKAIWEQSWDAYINPATRTLAITFAKNEQRKFYEKLLRRLIKNLQCNLHITPDELRSIGIAVRPSVTTPAPVAADPPDAETDTSVIGQLTIHFFRRGGMHRRGKPDGQRGVEIRWALSPVPLTHRKDLIHAAFHSHSPFKLSFENDRRGKTLYFALRWENTRGRKGPWSAIYEAIIP
jgi:hypothetical protein